MKRTTSTIIQPQDENQIEENSNLNHSKYQNELDLQFENYCEDDNDFNLVNEFQNDDSVKTIISDKWKYIGKTNSEGKRHGLGLQLYKNGDQFIGTFENGKKVGFGKLTRANNEILKGEFLDNRLEGYLELTKKNGILQEGFIKKNSYELILKKEDLTVEVCLISSSKGKNTFLGKLVSQNSIYEGEMNNKFIPDGWGITIVRDKYTYKGQSQNGYLNGYGEFYYADGTKSFGKYLSNKKHGCFINFYKESRISFENYQKGNKHGPCILCSKNVMKTEIWNNGFRAKTLDKFDNSTKVYFKTYYPEYEWIQKFNLKTLIDYYFDLKDDELKRLKTVKNVVKEKAAVNEKNENKPENENKSGEMDLNLFDENTQANGQKKEKEEVKNDGNIPEKNKEITI